MKYRTRSEIICEVLVSARSPEGVTKTKIMFNAYLSFAQLKEYLAILLENGMLDHLPESNKYRTTDKGVKMLAAWNKVNEFISEAPDA